MLERNEGKASTFAPPHFRLNRLPKSEKLASISEEAHPSFVEWSRVS